MGIACIIGFTLPYSCLQNPKTTQNKAKDQSYHYSIPKHILLNPKDTATTKKTDSSYLERVLNKIEPFNEYFSRIDQTSWVSIDTFPDMNKSTEGGEIISFKDEHGIQRIKCNYYGEMGRLETTMYFSNKVLLGVKELEISYTQPIYWDGAKMKENNDSVAFTEEYASVIEMNYYFKNDKLFQIYSPSDCGSPFSAEYYNKEQTRILKNKDDILKKVMY